MSWVAEAKAAMVNRISERVKVESPALNPIRATVRAISSCMETIHHRLLRNMSTNGLQRGFIIQGSPIRLVIRARVPLSMPISLNITTDMVLTMKYGRPSTK